MKSKTKNKKPPKKSNPVAKFNSRVNHPKIIPVKKSKGPQREEWDS